MQGQLPGTGFAHPQAIGITENGKLVGGVVYDRFTPFGCEMSIATLSPRWASRGRLHAFFFYPFCELGLVRVTALTARNNKRSRRMLEKLGFSLEGKARRAFDGRQDLMIYGLLRADCKWIREDFHGRR